MMDDDHDRRFREIIADEFGTEVGPAPQPVTEPSLYKPFLLGEALANADPEPDVEDRFVPPPASPIPHPRRFRVKLALSFITFAVVIAMVELAVDLNTTLIRIAGAVGVIGLAGLLFSIPWQRRDLDDDGAVT